MNVTGVADVAASPAGAAADSKHGPSALGGDLRRFVSLTVTLATTEFKLRYFGSVLGYFWSLMKPVLFFGVLYVVFGPLLKLGKGVPHYPAYLLTSVMLWTFFVEATSNSVQCLLAREGLLRKMRFPRLVIPLSVGLVALFNLLTNFIAVFAFAVASGIEPRLSWLELPGLVVLLAVLAVSAGMLLSVLYVRFRDILPIWEVTVQILFYGSPVIWTAYLLAEKHLHVVRLEMCNPIAAILTQIGHAFIDPRLGSAADYIGGAVRLLIPLGIIALVFVAGLWFFRREAPRIAENI
ncbi:MAG TPA: ABC transporter permease [Solirubrobacteraceae bacterium]|jgi:ABC-2 type transport system permease protein|nr:ABC transporter permease [Solirubrobacteraceae bacterium]